MPNKDSEEYIMAGNMINPQVQAQVEFFKSSVLPTVSHAGRGAVKQATENFEALFIQDLLKVMRQSTSEGKGDKGLFNSSNSKDIYTSMIDTELSKNLAKGRGLGLGSMLLRQFDKNGVSGAEKTLKNGLKSLGALRPDKGVSKLSEATYIKPLRVLAQPSQAADTPEAKVSKALIKPLKAR
jgi:flagellar protein FlgJ